MLHPKHTGRSPGDAPALRLRRRLLKNSRMAALALVLSTTGFGACLEFPCAALDSSCNPGAAALLLTATIPVNLRLQDSGQAVCYTGAEIPCASIAPGQPYYGQDGHHIDRPRAPGLVAVGNGTVLDPFTDLQWSACSIQSSDAGLLTGPACDNGMGDLPGPITQAAASTVCTGLNLGGHSDWRLPGIHEIVTLLDLGSPTRVNASLFPGNATQGYLTATANPDVASSKLNLSFSNGGIVQNNTLVSGRARCVRGAPPEIGDFFAEADVVLDKSTGLIWQRCAAGSAGNCNITPTSMTWLAALDYCASLELFGANDWRLPNLLELHSLMSYESAGIVVDSASFPDVSGTYWTSTSNVDDPDLAGHADFEANSRSVEMTPKPALHSVRCVRGP